MSAFRWGNPEDICSYRVFLSLTQCMVRPCVARGLSGTSGSATPTGDTLLAGLIRCKRCGRKLTVRYTGMKHHIPRYSCSRAWMDNGGPLCIAYGGLRVDDAIEEALLGVVGPGAIPPPTAAARGAPERQDQVRDALSRDLETARYAANPGFRENHAAGPPNPLVARG